MARNTNFYYSFLALPRAKREAIVAVWDLCRAIDDVADEPRTPRETKRERLGDWRVEVARAFEGGVTTTPQGRAVQVQLGRFPLPRRAFDELIDGVLMDVEGREYRTFDDLEDYCYHVASTVGLMCLEIFGYSDVGAREYAIALGKAFQLTNILRDVGTDFRNGRVYVPLDELQRVGCPLEDLGASRPSPALEHVLKTVAARAREAYRRAAVLCPAGERRGLVSAEIMTAIYRSLLDEIERCRFDVLRAPVRLSRFRKARLAAATWLTARLSTSRGSA